MIREYRTDDLSALLEVWADASAVGHPFLNAEFLEAERQNIARLYLPASETWVWEADGRVVGFISLMGVEIGGLFVDPTHHGRGIGRALVEHARGLREELEAEVFGDNALGRAFYAACGFIEIGDGIHPETSLAVVRLRLPSAGTGT